MPVIPFSSASRAASLADEAVELRAEEEAKRYRAEADAKLKRLMAQGVKKFDPQGGQPMIDIPERVQGGPRLNAPGVETVNPYLESGTPDMRGFVPAEGSELWNQFEQDRMRKADPGEVVSWQGGDSAMGAGGPDNPVNNPAITTAIQEQAQEGAGGLSAQDIAELKEWRRKREQETSDLRMRQTLGAADKSPDEVAKALELAGKTGANRLEVQENLKSFQQSDAMSRIEGLRQTAPKLRTWLDDPVNLEVAHDDTESLGWWEQAQKTGGEFAGGIGGALTAGWTGISESALGLAQNASEGNDAFASWVAGRPIKSGVTSWLEERRKGAAQVSEYFRPDVEDPTARAALQGVESLPISAFAIATTIMSGGTAAPGLVVMGAGTAGKEYGTARDQGMSWAGATSYAMGQGSIEAATELLPMKWLVGDIVKETPFVKTLLKNQLAEGATEQVATHTQDFLAWAVLPENADKTINDFLSERGSASYDTLVASLVGSGVQTAVAKGADVGLRQLSEGYRQKRAEDLARFVEAIGENAANSALLKRLPDKYREAVAAITKDGPRENVYIAPEALSSLAATTGKTVDQLAQAFRIDPDMVTSALDTGEFVPVPVGNYAAVIETAKKEIGVAGVQIHSALANDIKFGIDPKDATVNEIKEAKALFEAERDAASELRTQDTGYADSVDRIRAEIRDSVKATGLYTDTVAEVQADLAAKIAMSLPLNTGADVDAFWQKHGPRIRASISGESIDLESSLTQSVPREVIPISDFDLKWAAEDLEPKQFEAWKGAREGLSNQDIADRMNEAEPDAVYTAKNVEQWIHKARAHGYDAAKARNRIKAPETERIIELRARGRKNADIATSVYPDVETSIAVNRVKALASKNKAAIAARKAELEGKALAQGDAIGGLFTPPRDGQKSVIDLFEKRDFITLGHEFSHWYLDTLWRMAREPDAHPFVQKQWAAILNWHGKHPEWDAMFDAAGNYTAESKQLHETFAETFEVYMMTAKAPSTDMRSVFSSIRHWMLSTYRALRSGVGGVIRSLGIYTPQRIKAQEARLGRRMTDQELVDFIVAPEIREVLDRMVAAEDAIAGAQAVMIRDSEAMAKSIMEKLDPDKKWSDERRERYLGKLRERYAAAKERAESELMARLIDERMRVLKAGYSEEERQTRREVQSEIDERPEQRAYQALTGIWRDTREAAVEQAFTEAEQMRALAHAPELGFFDANATTDSIMALQSRMIENGIVPVVLLFRTTSGRVIAFPGDSGNFGLHHDMAREVFGLGNLKMQHGVWNPRRWPTLEAMSTADTAWYETTGTEADVAVPAPEPARLQRGVSSLAQGGEGLLVYRGTGDTEPGAGRLGMGLYFAEDPEIGAEWGGETGTVDAYRITGPLFDLTEETAQGLENYAKRENTPQAEALFARLKAEGYVGIRDPWSGHINVFDAKDMVRQPDADMELGQTWTNFALDAEETGSLAHTVGKANSFASVRSATDEEAIAWYDANVTERQRNSDTLELVFKSRDTTQAGSERKLNDVKVTVKGDERVMVDMAWRGSMSSTAGGTAADGVRIFARTILALRAYVLKNNPKAVIFTGATEDHVKLYRAMLRTMSAGEYRAYSVQATSSRVAELNGVVQAGTFPMQRYHAVGSPYRSFVLAKPEDLTPDLKKALVSDGFLYKQRSQLHGEDAVYKQLTTVEELGAGAGRRDAGRAGTGEADAGSIELVPIQTGQQSLAHTVGGPSLAVVHNLTEQNLIHADEIGGLAAPSLAIVDTDKGVLNNFGNITLVAEPSLLDSPKVRTFDADIYSPRHPRAEYDIDDKEARAVNQELKDATQGLGDLRDADWNGMERDGPSALVRSELVKAAFFAQRGDLPKRLPRKEIPEADAATKQASKLDVIAKEMWVAREDQRVRELAAEHFADTVKVIRKEDPELADKVEGQFFTQEEDGSTSVNPNYLWRFILDAKAYRKASDREVDTIELGSMLSKKLRDKKVNAEFEAYVEKLATRVIKGKSLFRGFTSSGNRRYSDYTMENILREMTGELQGGEKWNYGAGSIRARYAREMKSITAIRARKGQLVAEGEMEAAKSAAQDRLQELLAYLKPFYRFGGGNQFMAMDDMSKAIAEGPSGVREAFDFQGDPEPQQRIRDFIDFLVNLPTEYFEAKAGRAVDLSEFKAAIVPRNVSERALSILQGAGLQIRYYAKNNAEDRARAVRGVTTALFHTRTGRPATTTPPTSIPPMRLNLQAVKELYGEQALADLPPDVAAHAMQANDVEQFVELARAVRKSMNQKKPKTLWKFLSTVRKLGDGVTYKGIRDTDGELIKMIGKRKEFPGLIADKENDGKRARSYTVEEAAQAAWEAGYFNGDNPPDPDMFLLALRDDLAGTNPVYSVNDLETVRDIEQAEQWAEWFDLNDVNIAAPGAELREKLAVVVTAQGETAIGPDEAAQLFNAHFKRNVFPTGAELLAALEAGPARNKLIREETRRRMIKTHGDIFASGKVMEEAQEYARNEIQHRQFEIELDALAQAAGKQASSNLAKQEAIANLRTKQVREVLNYNQWLVLERRWAQKALEAAGKGDMAKAAEYARFRLINSHMYVEGKKLAERIEKTRKHLLAYDSKTKRARLFAAGKDYADQMAGLLSDYQLRNESKKAEDKRASRAVWLQSQMAGIDPFAAYADPTKTAQEQMVAAAEAIERSALLARLAEGVDATNYKSLTVEELDAVRDEADLLWKLATLKDRLIKDGERRRLSLAAGDVAAEVEANQPNEKAPEPIETDVPGEKVKAGVKQYFAMHRTLQSLARQFAGGKDGGVFWRYIVRPLNEAFSRLSSLRKEMGSDVADLFGVYTKAEQERFYRDRRHFKGIGRSLTTQGRLAIALNWGNEKNRQRIMDAYGWDQAQVQEVLDSLEKRDWDFVQSVWDYMDKWFPEANRVHEAVHGAPMTKEAPLQVATRFGIYRGGYYPIKFDPKLSSKAGQRAVEAEAKQAVPRVGTRVQEGFTKKRVNGKVTMPLRLSALDVIVQHLDEVAKSIATEETLFDVGRILKQKQVEDAIVSRHGRQIYNTIINQVVTAKFGMEGTSGLLAHLRNGATVVGLSWKVATASLQILGASNSIVRVGSSWMARGYARMGKDAATLESSARWIMARSEFMRHRREQQSPEMSSLLDAMKTKWTPDFVARVVPRELRGAHNWFIRHGFALMANVQFYSVDMPTWYGAYLKATHDGANEADAIAMADQAVIDAQGGGELHQLASMQSGAGTKYAALLRILTNFMSYMVTTYNLGVQRVRNARTTAQIAALGLDMVLLAVVPVAGKMLLDALTKGVGGDDEPEEWAERYAREQIAFLFGPFVGISQFAGAARGDDSYGYKGPAGLAIFNEMNQLGAAVAEGDFDASFWKPANRAAGIVFHYPASQIDASVRGALAYFNGETENPAAFLFGPPPN